MLQLDNTDPNKILIIKLINVALKHEGLELKDPNAVEKFVTGGKMDAASIDVGKIIQVLKGICQVMGFVCPIIKDM